MENKKWNKEDWQGRRKDQVEYSYMIAGICIVILCISALIILI